MVKSICCSSGRLESSLWNPLGQLTTTYKLRSRRSNVFSWTSSTLNSRAYTYTYRYFYFERLEPVFVSKAHWNCLENHSQDDWCDLWMVCYSVTSNMLHFWLGMTHITGHGASSVFLLKEQNKGSQVLTEKPFVGNKGHVKGKWGQFMVNHSQLLLQGHANEFLMRYV